MSWLTALRRLRHSRGYGVHSPFAFNLIQKVLSSTDCYYAFDDIIHYLDTHFPDEVVKNSTLHHLSFKLVNYFKVKEILEIHSGKGVHTLYLLSPARDIHAVCVEKRQDQMRLAREITSARSNQCRLVDDLPAKGDYEAVFLHLEEEPAPSMDTLLTLSGDNCFWVVHPLIGLRNKQFWNNIVKDKRFGFTFTTRHIGVAFLRETYSKLHYDV